MIYPDHSPSPPPHFPSTCSVTTHVPNRVHISSMYAHYTRNRPYAPTYKWKRKREQGLLYSTSLFSGFAPPLTFQYSTPMETQRRKRIHLPPPRSKLESPSRHEDEEYNNTNAHEHRTDQNHERALVHEAADVRFLDARPGHEGVFAETEQGQDWVDAVLLRREAVDANCEGEN